MQSRNWQIFPEENPNLVIECDTSGNVLYANPEARARFPDLEDLGWRHPLLEGIHRKIGGFGTGKESFVAREVELDDALFEQKICFSREGEGVVLRIYAHDVTALHQAEEKLHDLARDLVVAQESERQRISRELHDQVGQELAALKISLQLLKADVGDGRVEDALGDVVNLVDELRDQIRVVAKDLRPPMIDALGLDAALRSICEDMASRTKVEIDYEGGKQIELPEAVEASLYRFVQEAVTNAVVHADPHKIEVSSKAGVDELVVRVEDDGIGFDPQEISVRREGPGGMGLVGMKERIDLLGGSLEIDSAPGAGARLTARIPTR